MAEGYLRRLLHERGIDGISVESAGVSGWEDSPATPEAVQALQEKGIDISEHRARRLDRGMVERADLIVAMASEHRDAVGELVPSATARTFTLKELVYLLGKDPDPSGIGPRSPMSRVRARVERANALRANVQDGEITDEDVSDPLGLGIESFRASAWELEGLSERLVAQLFGQTGAEAGEDVDRGG